jgi:lysophospholipid acyltransferase (LPLAT)-like uncharacterized protein
MKISGEKQLNFLAKMVYLIFRIQEPFTRIKEVNNPEIKPCVYAMWHAHQCCIHGIKDRGNLNVLISRSIDGEIIARTVEKWGFKVVRGSKGKKGAIEATMQLIERLKNKECIAMMVDGPSGPVFQVKDGVIKIAKMAQAPIVPIFWYSPDRSFLKISSWDSFRYPFFYTRLLNLYGEPIYVNADNTDEQDEEVRIKLQNSLNELEKKAHGVWKETFEFRLGKKNEKNS